MSFWCVFGSVRFWNAPRRSPVEMLDQKASTLQIQAVAGDEITFQVQLRDAYGNILSWPRMIHW